MNIPQDDGDLNAQYDAEMRKIAEKAPKEVKVQSEAERQEDYYKGFRSAVVLVWMFCNFALAAVVLSTAGLERIAPKSSETQRSTIYMAVVLWSVAGLSLFRFTGAVWFLIVRIVSKRCSLAGKMDELIRFRSFEAFDDRASASPWRYVGSYLSVLMCRFYFLDTPLNWSKTQANFENPPGVIRSTNPSFAHFCQKN